MPALRFRQSEKTSIPFLSRFQRRSSALRRLRVERSDEEIEARLAFGRPVSWYATADDDGLVHIIPGRSF